MRSKVGHIVVNQYQNTVMLQPHMAIYEHELRDLRLP